MDHQARAVSPAERRTDAARQLALNPDDSVAWLLFMRDIAAADRDDAFARDDKLAANRHDAEAVRYFKAAVELDGLRQRMAVAERLLAGREEEGR